MPYRVHVRAVTDDALERLIELGALDVESLDDRAVVALMPDRVDRASLAAAVGTSDISISPATPRDEGSVWVLRPHRIRIGRLTVVPAGGDSEADALTLIDSPVFGSGLHPTTALCLELLVDLIADDRPASILDVGTGSGLLALAALKLGVAHATAIDIDDAALRVAAENARINGMSDRVTITRGGPETIDGQWPLVLANILASPLIDMAPTLVRRVGHHGQLVLSGIPQAVEPDVTRAYRHLGMVPAGTRERGGWVALQLRASW